MSEEEIIKYAKIFSNAKGDTYKINFVNESKTIDEVEIWKEILKLIDKKDKVIDLMATELFNYANLNILGICEAELENGNYDMNLCKMSLANRNCCECIKKHFYKKAEEEK